MPRTETCTACEGTGDINDYTPGGAGQQPCDVCGGNGYVPAAEPTIHDALKTLREAEAQDPEPNFLGTPELPIDIDLTNTKPVPGRMANQTWRILEEQRMAAEETIAECEAEIERWTAKMVDAIKAKRGCEAGQRALEGGA